MPSLRELQQEFASLWHAAPGGLVDKNFEANLRGILEKLPTRMGIFVAAKRNPDDHTVIIMLQLRKLPGVSTEPADSGAPLVQIRSQDDHVPCLLLVRGDRGPVGGHT